MKRDAAQIVLALHLPVEPLQPVGRDHLEAGRGFGRNRNSLFEKFQGFAEAVAVAEHLADVEIDAPRPHPALGALFRRRPDHRGGRRLLLEIFADRGDLRQIAAVVEFKRRHLAVRIAFEMLRLPIFAAAQIDGLLGDIDAFFRHEHADDARVRSDRSRRISWPCHSSALWLPYLGHVSREIRRRKRCVGAKHVAGQHPPVREKRPPRPRGLERAGRLPKIFVSPRPGNDFASNKSYQMVNLYWRFRRERSKGRADQR